MTRFPRSATIAAAMLLGTACAAGASTPCGTITNDLDRLTCYDKESGRTPVAQENKTGNWAVKTEKSEFEDTTDVYASVLSEEPVLCGRFSPPQKARLYVRCLENKTAVFINTGCHLASGFSGYGKVDIRLDDQKAFSVSMDASTDNSALGLWNGGQAIPLAKKMLDRDQMIVRFTPFSESPVTAQFVISGMKDAIEPLRAACKW